MGCAGLGVWLVIVIGHQQQIDERLEQVGKKSCYVGGYRISDLDALRASVECSGISRMEVSSLFPKQI